MDRQQMPVRDAHERTHNFLEVALGYTKEQAVCEAKRCLNCKNKPCVNGCPVNIDIPGFITKLKEKDVDGAYDVISKQSYLAAICGRVCPQESQCEKLCVRGIKGEPVAIGRLERYAADNHTEKALSKPVKNGKRVAIVGSGPASLSCASDLCLMGYDVTVFEALHTAGGVLVYGIPEFRLPKSIVQKEIDKLIELGVKIETDCVIGKMVTVSELLEEYDAVFIGSGAGLPRFMGIEGENLNGVYSANEFLTRINLMKAYKEDSVTPIHKGKNICVVGGGNVAMDAARCAKRLGGNVTIVYRRTEKELPARREEVEHAMEEGIVFKMLTNPVKIYGENNWVTEIECEQMKLGEPDASGRARPEPIEGSNFKIPCDCVIMSIGTSPNPLLKNTTADLEVDRRGCIVTDEFGKTSIEGVYAGGDAVSGAATVILAMGAGKKASKAIDEYLKNK